MIACAAWGRTAALTAAVRRAHLLQVPVRVLDGHLNHLRPRGALPERDLAVGQVVVVRSAGGEDAVGGGRENKLGWERRRGVLVRGTVVSQQWGSRGGDKRRPRSLCTHLKLPCRAIDRGRDEPIREIARPVNLSDLEVPTK